MWLPWSSVELRSVMGERAQSSWDAQKKIWKDMDMMTYVIVHRNPLVTESVPKFRPEVHTPRPA